MSPLDTPARVHKADEVDLALTGPGTPGGRFMRQFWIAVERAEDVPRGQARPIRIMGEDYAVYRGASGRAQVIAYRCPHRGAQMHLGWVEGDDIRCVYHGWKFDCAGQCLEQPAEEAGFARKVQIRTWPTREHMGLIYAYFGEGAPPAFPPFPAPPDLDQGLIENPIPPHIPCNYLQSFENSLDEVHVSFVHRAGGSHAGMYDLPEIGAEETDWGVLRTGRRSNGEMRVSLHYMPAVTRVIVPPMAGFDGVGGWKELYLHFVPVDDDRHKWLITYHVKVMDADRERYLAKRDEYERKVAAAGPAADLAREVMAGRLAFTAIQHPDRVRVQDVAVQAGQGLIADRAHEHLGCSDTAIILWRKILARECRAIAEGRPVKRWTPAPASVVPTLGF